MGVRRMGKVSQNVPFLCHFCHFLAIFHHFSFILFSCIWDNSPFPPSSPASSPVPPISPHFPARADWRIKKAGDFGCLQFAPPFLVPAKHRMHGQLAVTLDLLNGCVSWLPDAWCTQQMLCSVHGGLCLLFLWCGISNSCQSQPFCCLWWCLAMGLTYTGGFIWFFLDINVDI